MQKILNKYQSILICLVLAGACLGVYWQVRNFEFLSFDDDWYVSNNNYIKEGLTRDSIAWAFSFTNQVAQTGNWHPLTSLSHILDVEFYGLNPAGHHITNVMLHAVNTILLFLLLRYMTSKPWRSAFVAALFALHPFHVESVAWVSERKDVLSTLLWLLTIYSYAWYVRKPKTSRYILTLLAFTGGLMAKPMLVTLPFVLLLLDYWPLGRFNAPLSVENTDRHRRLIRLIVEKIPFLGLAAAVCIITVIAQQNTWAVATQDNLPLNFRLLNVPISYVMYIEKTFWPSRLAFFYPHPISDISLWVSAASVLLLVILSILVFRFRQSKKYLPVGWLWYLGTLIPVIGIIQVGRQAMADRYTYIPLIGLFMIVAWGVCDLLENVRYRKIILSLSAAAVLLPLGVVSWRQVGYWHDDITLFKRGTEAVKGNWWAYQLLGHTLVRQGRLDEAISSYKESIRLVPDSMEVQNDLGYALLQQGNLEEAIALYKKMLPELPDTATSDAAVPIRPESGKLNATIQCYAQAHVNLGAALDRQDKLDEAIRHYMEALRVRPDYAVARKNLGNAFIRQGKFDQAIEQLEKYLRIEPNSMEGRISIAYALMLNGRPDEAIVHIREIIRMQPNSAIGLYMLATVYQRQGKTTEAIEVFNKAAELAKTAGEKELAGRIQYQLNVLESK
ncbi:MAG: tetratricopeptide repeat protein [Sedimentisphaerales bacterium]|jgi:tetratricopeptide (TPR) repeat protein